MSIKIKSIYDPVEENDGFRVLVTRLWPRGIRKELVDLWIKDLGPSKELLRSYKDGKMDWEDFRDRYLDEYKKEGKGKLVKELKERIKESGKKTTTIMCTCRDENHCHSGIVKDKL